MKSLIFIFLLISSSSFAQEFTSFRIWEEKKNFNVPVSELQEKKAKVTVTDKIVYIDWPEGQDKFFIIKVEDDIALALDQKGTEFYLYFVEFEDSLSFHIYIKELKTFLVLYQ